MQGKNAEILRAIERVAKCTNHGKQIDVRINKDFELPEINGKDLVVGLASVLEHLCTVSGMHQLVGTNIEESAALWQWIELVHSFVKFQDSRDGSGSLFKWMVDQNLKLLSADCPSFHNFYKVLDEHLKRQAFLVGEKLTIADLFLYMVLHDTVVKMTAEAREQNMHLCRWMDLVQHDPLISHEPLQKIVISKTLLYPRTRSSE